ncbi:MAG TPA: tetratricopeptide repeat protein [Rhodocyclaceae bacterium]|nr:tetratricopeptide repeat protein [Rhodocyclaceae bacterium]
MAVYDLEEQEQISQIKAWWEQYGKLVTAVAVAAAVASVGWQGFNWYRDKQAAEAGTLFFAVQQASEAGDAGKAREAAGRLIEQFPRTAYAQMGALLSASAQFEAGDSRNARAHLEWLAVNGRDALLQDLARLRLATILLDEGDYAAALAQLDKAPAASLTARFEDLRGDVHAMQGEHERARAAYRAALDALAAQGAEAAAGLGEVIRIKLEALEA